jgi:glycosyltransferase involved in cell wall biosynthesis
MVSAWPDLQLGLLPYKEPIVLNGPTVRPFCFKNGRANCRKDLVTVRVAHFVQRYPPALGGSEAYFARLSAFLASDGHEVTVFTTQGDQLESFWNPRSKTFPADVRRIDGVTIRRYPLWRMPGRRLILGPLSRIPVRSWQRLALPCNPISLPMWRDAGQEASRFDIVHVTAFPYAWPLASGLRLARRQSIPFLVTPFLHLGDPDNPRDATRRSYTRPALAELLHAADRVFVQTASEWQLVAALGIPEDRLVLLGMGVDTSECTGGDRSIRQAWSVCEPEPVIGLLANQSAEKGTIDLLKAAAILWRSGLGFKVVLAGPQMPSFTRFWKNFDAKESVIQLGVLSERQKRDFYAAIDLFVMPSRSDAFGMVLLEAWANGRPNVAYRAGGVADVIRHEVDGLLVKCGDVKQLAKSIAALAFNAALREQFGEAGRLRIEREFRWRDKLSIVQSVYEKVTGCAGSRIPPEHFKCRPINHHA